MQRKQLKKVKTLRKHPPNYEQNVPYTTTKSLKNDLKPKNVNKMGFRGSAAQGAADESSSRSGPCLLLNLKVPLTTTTYTYIHISYTIL